MIGMMDKNDDFLLEIKKIRKELEEALREVSNKLNFKQRQEFQQELKTLDELLARLETGLVWVAFFGKASVGKSSTINSLAGEDIAKVGVEMGTTTEAAYYSRHPWKLVDVPGILDGKILEDIAIAEAKKAHGHILVIDGEPTEVEISLFKSVCNATPNRPRIVYVNKWDRVALPEADKQRLSERISEKMRQFVTSPNRIVYGSASVYDPERDCMVRQEIPQLLEALYDTAGVFGEVVNILDPAKKAENITGGMRNSVLEMRKAVARKVINWFGILTAVSGFVPYTLLTSPTIQASMVYLIFLIMGKKEDKSITGKVTIDLLKACAKTLAWLYGGGIATGIATLVVFGLNPLAGLVLGGVGLTAISYFAYRTTVILGEVTIEYVINDCSWGAEGPEAVIRKCAKQAEKYYFQIQDTIKVEQAEDNSQQIFPKSIAISD